MRRDRRADDLFEHIRPAAVRIAEELVGIPRAWWRGFAYGTVAELAVVPWSPRDLEPLVNLYENSKGDLQWVILVTNDSRAAVGVHTWVEVYLTPVYRDILQALGANGYHVTRAVRGMDGLWKFLTGVSEIKGVAFPEFRDRP